MTNPWLHIPASDYEGHMGFPGVDQLSFLAQTLKESLSKYDSTSLAYLGCATGNGLEHIDTQITRRLTVIDINPEYLEILKSRYEQKIPNLKIIKADLNEFEGNNQSYSLIFAGLIFEYLSPVPLLGKIANWLENEGDLVVVLQMQDQNEKMISDTPYSSLKSLSSIMNLVPEESFKLMAKECGMRETESKTITLESGKSFYVAAYKKSAY